MARSNEGQTLPELMVIVAILGFIAIFGVPGILSMVGRTSLKSAVSRVKVLLAYTRDEAVTLQTHCGIRFQQIGETWYVSVYQDMDGDGVLNSDISAGTDRLLHGPEILFPAGGVAVPGIIDGGFRDPDGDPIEGGSSPVRFGTSRICSFSPSGAATPGTLYLMSCGRMAAVRTSGDPDSISVLYYDSLRGKWADSM